MQFLLAPILAIIVLIILVPRTRLARLFAPTVPPAAPAPPVKDADLLLTLLAREDVACPTCKYNLRGSKCESCPECGTKLAVVLVPRHSQRFLMRLVVISGLALMVQYGYGSYFYVAMLWRVLNASPTPRSMGMTLILNSRGAVQAVGALVLMAVFAARAWRNRDRDLALNWMHPACGMIITVVVEMSINLAAYVSSAYLGFVF